MWDKDYYHDKALYGQGMARINQARRDTAKLNASVQSSYVRPKANTGSSGDTVGVFLVAGIALLIVAAMIITAIAQAVAWYTSDPRYYIATGAIIAPIVVVWIRRHLLTRLPMLPELVSVASVVVVAVTSCFLAEGFHLGLSYWPAIAAVVGCVAYLITEHFEISTTFDDESLRANTKLALEISLGGMGIILILDMMLMGALIYFGVIDEFQLGMAYLGASEGQILQIVFAAFLACAFFGVCKAE